jgi:hypothetical protein
MPKARLDVPYSTLATIYVLATVVFAALLMLLMRFKLVSNINALIDLHISRLPNPNPLGAVVARAGSGSKRYTEFKLKVSAVDEVLFYPQNPNTKPIDGLDPATEPQHNLCCLIGGIPVCSNKQLEAVDTDESVSALKRSAVDVPGDNDIMCVLHSGRLQIQLTGPAIRPPMVIQCKFHWTV